MIYDARGRLIATKQKKKQNREKYVDQAVTRFAYAMAKARPTLPELDAALIAAAVGVKAAMGGQFAPEPEPPQEPTP